MIPANYQWLVEYNPLADMVLSWRELFMNGNVDYEKILSLYGMGIITVIVGSWVFNKLKFRFAEIL
jgi:lipopolysaccharide transport system permease protein